jgi:iron complex transport system substrate-binding protein
MTKATRSTGAPTVWLSLLLLCVSPLVARAGDIVFEDQRDKLITLGHPAQRVVVLPKPIASMFIAVDGGTRHLAGIHPAAQSVIMKGVLGTIFPEVARIDTDVVREGFIPNVEEMLKVDPDVVIQWALKVEDYIEPLERVGLTVVGLGYGTNEIERERIAIVGKIVDRQERASSFLAWQDDTRSDIEKNLSSVAPERRSRIVFLDRLRGDGLFVFGRNEFFFQAAGVRNVAFEAGLNQPTVAIDAEQLLAWDPDIIFMNYYDEQGQPSDLYASPVLANLAAVKAGRVYKTPRLDPASHEAPLVWMWMAMLAYPELYHRDVRGSIREKYAALYGKSPSATDLDTILEMAANDGSRHYREMFGN